MDYDTLLKVIIKNKVNDKESYEKFINKCQHEYSSSMYPSRSKYDKINCIVCGGCYTRHQKYHHEKTKKHLKQINGLYEYITDS